MAIDQAVVGQVVTEQMQAIEEDYNDDQEHKVGGVITIVEILTPEGDGMRSEVRVRNNIGDPYRALGLLKIAERSLLGGMNVED